MKTWDDYKNYIKAVDPVMAREIEEIERKVSEEVALSEDSLPLESEYKEGASDDELR